MFSLSYLLVIPAYVSLAAAACFGSPLNALIGCKITERSFLVHSFFPLGRAFRRWGWCAWLIHLCLCEAWLHFLTVDKVHQKVLIKVIEMMGAMEGDR